MSAEWVVGLVLASYFAIGCCAAAWRAYIDPWLVERKLVTKWGWDIRSDDFGIAVFLHLIGWPIALCVSGTTVIGEHIRMCGERRHEREKIVARRRAEDEQEIERIIREAKL